MVKPVKPASVLAELRHSASLRLYERAEAILDRAYNEAMNGDNDLLKLLVNKLLPTPKALDLQVSQTSTLRVEVLERFKEIFHSGGDVLEGVVSNIAISEGLKDDD